eukprot:CAMPEP_0116020230 /NCGR_PEP_ID=MMETSP0321-20121206/9680_1 /TAXON_ID=163516 /ORGANISM="Leptocylindrus danicus var. danicus, Strain B650" /LENGTH=618 /DNA_ID=CAMNT_0003490895 /DNA_START=64 /DNA_END=1920 /DNA_ORIENTATION=+
MKASLQSAVLAVIAGSTAAFIPGATTSGAGFSKAVLRANVHVAPVTLIHRTTTTTTTLSATRSDVGYKERNNNSKIVKKGTKNNSRAALKLLTKAAVSLSVLALTTTGAPHTALAKASGAVETVEHLHVGQKIAKFFQSFGLSDVAVLALISALPVVELRGAVPVGVWMGLPITTVLPACILGNMIPIIPLLFLLKNEKLKQLMSPILNRAAEKSKSLGVGSVEKQWASLAAFVGVPLPGTGAWTGAMGAFLLGMPTPVALSSIFTGVCSAGVIMSAITLAGKKGGIAALSLLAVLTGMELIGKKEESSKQDFLEAEPYWDQSNVPVNVHKNKAPFTGKVVSTKRIVGPKATGETCHIIIDHKGDFPYWEGQSWGVIPPGTREKDGKPHSVRLYSIASSRYGDDMTGKTGSLCVRRATYWCPELQAEDPAKKGICSNFLCDTQPGDEVMMTGPAGKVMLLPEKDPSTDYIMVATGTGIAPYRGFIRRLFTENTPAANAYKGQAWLFLGVANSDALLYDDEWQTVKEEYPDNFRLDYALSREQNNKKGGKMYIQDKVEEYADEIFTKLDNGAHIYFCGLKGMMPGIQDMLKEVCASKKIDFDEWIKGLKKNKQWHVEVY